MADPPLPPKERHDGGGATVSLFLDTDLGTHLALLVTHDTTIQGLKSRVATEHAAAFPDLGPVAVKSFQVRRKGVLYHLSDSMTVTSAFTRIKGGCSLYVQMAEAVRHCCQDAPSAIDGRSSDGFLRIHVEKHVRGLTATTSEMASDVLPQRLEGIDVAATLNNLHARDAVPTDELLPASSQLNYEMKKNEAVGLADDSKAGCDPVIDKAKSCSHQIKHTNQTEGAYISSTSMENIDKSSNQGNMSHVLRELHARKEGIFHGDGDTDIGGSVSDNKQVRVEEEMLEDVQAVDNLSPEKEHKKARRTGSFDKSAANPIRIINESEDRDMTKSNGDPLETNTTSQGEPLIASFRQDVHDTLNEDSIQVENPSTVGKKKKRRRRLDTSKTISAQETSEPSARAAELSKLSGDGAYNIELTGRDETVVKPASLPLSSSELNAGNQGAKHVQFVSDAQESTDLISEQEKFGQSCKGCRSPSSGDAMYCTAEVLFTQVKTTNRSSAPWDGGDKHKEVHAEGIVETSNVEKDGKSTDALEKRQTNGIASQEKKRKKTKEVSSVGVASMDTTGEIEMHGYRENAAKTDTVSAEKEIVIVSGPSMGMGEISNIVHQGDSNIIENPIGDGKKKKRRGRHSESSKDVDPSQDLRKSTAFVTNESLIKCKDATPLDANQTTQGNTEEATVSDHKKLGESHIAGSNVINEVLTDIRSKDSLSNNLDGDMLTGQTHLVRNQNALELPNNTEDKIGLTAALPPQYSAAVHSDAPAPRYKKSKGKQLEVLSTAIESSHHSSGVPEEEATTESKDSDFLMFSVKTIDHKDTLAGDVVTQADGRKTKRQRKKVSLKRAPTDDVKTSDERVNQVAMLDLKGVNATQSHLAQGGSVIESSMSPVGEQKGKRSSKTRTPKVLETNHPTHRQDSHLAKDSQNDYLTGNNGTHDNEIAAGAPAESPVVRTDAMSLKFASPNAQKERKKSWNPKLQSGGSALEHDDSADFVNSGTVKGLVSPKNSSDAAKPNRHAMIHPANDEINFLDHFSSSKLNDPSVSAENKQNNKDETSREVKNKRKSKRKQGTGSIEPNNALESLLVDKTSLTGHLGTSEAVVPAAENMNREDENVKDGKEKKRIKKVNIKVHDPEKENSNCDDQGIDIATQESLISVVQKGRLGQDTGKESNLEASQNNTIMHHGPEDATCNLTVEKKLHRTDVDCQNNLPSDKDHISKEVRKSTSQTKPHAKVRHSDESIKGRVTQPKAVSNIVKSFSMSPPVSSDSTEVMPQNENRYRFAVRKVLTKRNEQNSEKSKKGSRKVVSGSIFKDAISEDSDDELDTKSEKAAMEASPDNSSTSADSGISSDESEVPDDDGTASLSQKSLKHDRDIGSILRGSSSYKKARQKQTELLDDDTEVPDSQPADGLWN